MTPEVTYTGHWYKKEKETERVENIGKEVKGKAGKEEGRDFQKRGLGKADESSFDAEAMGLPRAKLSAVSTCGCRAPETQVV